jgi:hypothetical protein
MVRTFARSSKEPHVAGATLAADNAAPGPTVLVIFGAGGDLAWRKLMPALYHRKRGRIRRPNHDSSRWATGS